MKPSLTCMIDTLLSRKTSDVWFYLTLFVSAEQIQTVPIKSTNSHQWKLLRLINISCVVDGAVFNIKCQTLLISVFSVFPTLSQECQFPWADTKVTLLRKAYFRTVQMSASSLSYTSSCKQWTFRFRLTSL